MLNQVKLVRPSPKELKMNFEALTKSEAPANNRIYTCDTPSAIRAVAEYEDMGGVVISYMGTQAPDAAHTQLPPGGPRTFGIPDDLIVKMQQLSSENPVHIFILCDDVSEKKNIIKNLKKVAKSQKIPFDPELIHLIPWDADTYWTRDYSPWWVVDLRTGCYAISKHIYTTLGGGAVGLVEGSEDVNPREGSGIFRCNDDYGAVKISDYFNGPIRRWNKAEWSDKSKLDPILPHKWYFSGLLNVGGNYMVTSEGIIASSYLVASQNQLPTDPETDDSNPSPETLENRMNYIMKQTNLFLGAHKYYVFTDPTGTYIGHIDCWAKFLGNQKVLVASSEDENINHAFDEIENFFKNEKFEVYRVLCPKIYVATETEGVATTAPYTNSLILNKSVYVPLAGGVYQDYDKMALEVYEKAMPGYTIEGVIGKPETPWMGTDALHCRTNTIPRQVVNNWLKSLGKL